MDKCLTPLLDLTERGYKININISGSSLEIIKFNRPAIIPKLKNLIAAGNLELIGNGYHQIIQPNFSSHINSLNQNAGLNSYEEILGVKPKVATVNEQAFSLGSSASFVEVGYKKLLMESENLFELNQTDKSKASCLGLLETSKGSIEIVWTSSIAFQQFQRFVHGQISYEEYTIWLINEVSNITPNGYYCVYSSDAEIFDFRPRRYGTEAPTISGEWKRIEKLLSFYNETGQLTLISDLKAKTDLSCPTTTNARYPVVVKKQKKYNINRWSITGSDDCHLNADCNLLASKLSTNDGKIDVTPESKILLSLCSSDLRTHIEEGLQ